MAVARKRLKISQNARNFSLILYFLISHKDQPLDFLNLKKKLFCAIFNAIFKIVEIG